MNSAKTALARAVDATGLNDLLLRLQHKMHWPYARAVNYHGVPERHSGGFERQLEFFARHFVICGYEELLMLHCGLWSHDRPALVLTFDDGLRSHAEVVAPMLDRLGLTGWFFVPPGLVATSRSAAVPNPDFREEPMTWDDLCELHERHVIGCHTMTHCRLHAGLDPAILQHEIVDAKRLLEERLGQDVKVFGWVGGEESSYSAAAAKVIREAGFSMSFMTNNAPIRPEGDLMQLQRTNVEAHLPMSLVRFQISGLMDVMYTPKRRRVNCLTRAV